jgi:hypothetical protein
VDLPAGGNVKKAILRTGQPLTIACHIKKAYFLVVSAFLAAESIFLAEESIAILLESIAILLESTFAESVFAASVLALLLHAANAPIDNTTKNFFMLFILFVN